MLNLITIKTKEKINKLNIKKKNLHLPLCHK